MPLSAQLRHKLVYVHRAHDAGLPCVRHSSGSGSGSGSAAAASVPVAQPSRGVAAAATPQQYGAAAGGSNGSTFRGRTVEELEAWMVRKIGVHTAYQSLKHLNDAMAAAVAGTQ